MTLLVSLILGADVEETEVMRVRDNISAMVRLEIIVVLITVYPLCRRLKYQESAEK